MLRAEPGRHRRPLRRRWGGEEGAAGKEGDEERAAMAGWRSGRSMAAMRSLLFDIVRVFGFLRGGASVGSVISRSVLFVIYFDPN